MLKDITIGQYYPGDTLIHRMDPRVKLLATIAYIVCIFLFRGVIGLALSVAIIVVVAAIARIPAKSLLKGIRGIWPLIAITAACNLFFTQGGAVLCGGARFSITALGLHNAVFYSIRLVLLVVGASIMTLTTSPNKLTDGMEEGLKPLSKIGLPIHEMAMMMSIALRFIPILGEEAEKIKKAQLARGADFDEGSLLARARGMIPVLVPLFVSAFTRAQDLSLAMEARCYRGGAGRTRLHPLRYERRDVVAYILIAAMVAAYIILRIWDIPLPI